MSVLLAVLSRTPGNPQLRPAFDALVRAARALHGISPTQTCESEGGCAAAFARENGTGGSLSIDPATGAWIAAAGHPVLEGASLVSRLLAVGPAALARELDGPWSMVGWEPRGGAFTACDPAQLRPMFELHDEERGLVLLSSSSAILAVASRDASLDPIGCQEMLRTTMIFEGRTFFRDVHRVPAAVVRRYGPTRGQDRDETHWRIGDLDERALSGRRASDAFLDVLATAARRTSAEGRTIAIDLTGGYDSRTLFAGCLTAGIPLSATVTGPEHCDDVVLSREIAARAGVPHHWVPPPPTATFDDVLRANLLTDGEYDGVEYFGTASVHRSMITSHGGSINGSGGELARGRWWMFLLPRVGAVGPWDSTRLIRTRFAPIGDGSIFARSIRFDVVGHLKGVVDRLNADLRSAPFTVQCDHFYLEMMRAWHGRLATSTDRLWPVFSPFLTRPVLDRMLSVDRRTRMRSHLVRRMLWDHHRAIATIDTANFYPPIPLTPLTAHRFWKLPYRYAARISAKAARLAGLRLAVKPSYGPRKPARATLWADDRVRSILDPAKMATASLFDEQGLASFLDRSRTDPAFRFEAQWCRVLTIETATRQIAAARAALRTGTATAPVEIREPGRDQAG